MLAKDTLQVPLKEAADFQDKKLSKKMQALNQKPIKALQKQIQQVEKQIHTLIKEDDVLHHLFELVTSVSGVGEVIFWEVIITTNEFKLFSDRRPVAPVNLLATLVLLPLIGLPTQHSSGTSIRGKTRVSHLANKQLKQLFHMAAMSVTLRENELADYYHRKVEEGKSKMSVLNAVRNKIIHRIFACVRNDRNRVAGPYEKNYMTALA